MSSAKHLHEEAAKSEDNIAQGGVGVSARKCEQCGAYARKGGKEAAGSERRRGGRERRQYCARGCRGERMSENTR